MGMVDLADDLVVDAIPGLPGVSVTLSLAADFKDWLAFKRLGERITASSIETEVGAEDLESLIRQFGDQYLVEWNVGYRGELLPANGDGLVRCKRPRLQFYLLKAWTDAAQGLSGPLVEDSANGTPELPSGEPSLEASVLMGVS